MIQGNESQWYIRLRIVDKPNWLKHFLFFSEAIYILATKNSCPWDSDSGFATYVEIVARRAARIPYFRTLHCFVATSYVLRSDILYCSLDDWCISNFHTVSTHVEVQTSSGLLYAWTTAADQSWDSVTIQINQMLGQCSKPIHGLW